jgi:hypothetical protein
MGSKYRYTIARLENDQNAPPLGFGNKITILGILNVHNNPIYNPKI